jgi:hypothetical protein
MIVFDLLCGGGHRFEGWFSSAEDYSGQKGRGLLSCPSCGTESVERVPSATRFNAGAEVPAAQKPAQPEAKDAFAQAQILYSHMLDEILRNTEDVGDAFAAEARRIHYEETPQRSIRGRATKQEHDALVEEGVPVARIPIPPSGAWN